MPAEPDETCPRFELMSRDGKVLSELIVASQDGRPLSLYERDFLEGLALQAAVAVENAVFEWLRGFVSHPGVHKLGIGMDALAVKASEYRG